VKKLVAIAGMAAIAGWLGVGALFAGSAPSFTPARSYPTGAGPSSVAIGDLNRDGGPDLVAANYAVKSVSVFINTPGLCTVQNVNGKALSKARRTITHAGCRVGDIRGAYSVYPRGRVVSQKPRPGTVLPNRGKVNLIVSRGRRPS
jgi:hypothetical protein